MQLLSTTPLEEKSRFKGVVAKAAEEFASEVSKQNQESPRTQTMDLQVPVLFLNLMINCLKCISGLIYLLMLKLFTVEKSVT